MAIFSHPLFKTIKELKGNPRASLLTEPLFGIPFNMMNPYFSVYMMAFGINDKQIGTIASIGLVTQVLAAFFSGAIVDKYGRRKTLFIMDLLSWGVPCLVWAYAQDIRWFVIATIFNSLWRLSHTAWTCITVEDAREEDLVHIWTWVSIFVGATALFSPIGGWFVQKYGLVPAARGLFIFGFVMITIKAIVMYYYSHETERGIVRMAETKNASLGSLLLEYRSVFDEILASRKIHAALSLMVIVSIYQTVSGNFWPVLFTGKLGFESSQISLFAAMRSIVMTICFFAVGPRLTNHLKFRLPLWVGFSFFFVSQAMLVTMPAGSWFWMVLSVLLEGVGAALVNPMSETLLAISLEHKDRARISAMVYVSLILIISPFGWIAGQLSSLDRTYPFAMNMGLFALGAVLVWFISRPGFLDAEQPA